MAILNSGKRITVLLLHTFCKAVGADGSGQKIFTQVTGCGLKGEESGQAVRTGPGLSISAELARPSEPAPAVGKQNKQGKKPQSNAWKMMPGNKSSRQNRPRPSEPMVQVRSSSQK